MRDITIGEMIEILENALKVLEGKPVKSSEFPLMIKTALEDINLAEFGVSQDYGFLLVDTRHLGEVAIASFIPDYKMDKRVKSEHGEILDAVKLEFISEIPSELKVGNLSWFVQFQTAVKRKKYRENEIVEYEKKIAEAKKDISKLEKIIALESDGKE